MASVKILYPLFQVCLSRTDRFFFRACLKTYVKSQVGEFLLKLQIVKREHSGGYVTDEQYAS